MHLRTPVVLVTGLDEVAMAAAVLNLQCDLPEAVVVHHRLDVPAQQLTRIVSDLGGVREQEVIHLDHACVSCALRDDIFPTLDRLATAGLHSAIIARVPIAADGMHICRALQLEPQLARRFHVAALVTALNGESIATDLTGDDLLSERGLQLAPDDSRGVAELLCSMVEYADRVVVSGATTEPELALVTTLARPDATVHIDATPLDGAALVAGLREHDRAEAWVNPVPQLPPPIPQTGAWMLELGSNRPLHPKRLLSRLEDLGGGPWRTRGCFWLPTRPGDIGGWEGAGGQLSVGVCGHWGTRRQVTRLLFMGIDGPDRAEHTRQIQEAFATCLLSRAEMEGRRRFWQIGEDGLEPWLGPIVQTG